MRLIEAVNLILRKLGEIEVPSLDEPYPTIPIALAALDEARKSVLTEGWWFNTSRNWVATPAPDGTVELPTSCLMFYPDDPKYVFEGTAIVHEANHDPFIRKPVRGRLIMDKEFERLPFSAAMAVTFQAAASTYTADIGPDDTAQALLAQHQAYMMTLSAEHTRSRQRNSTQKRAAQRWVRRLTT